MSEQLNKTQDGAYATRDFKDLDELKKYINDSVTVVRSLRAQFVGHILNADEIRESVGGFGWYFRYDNKETFLSCQELSAIIFWHSAWISAGINQNKCIEFIKEYVSKDKRNPDRLADFGKDEHLVKHYRSAIKLVEELKDEYHFNEKCTLKKIKSVCEHKLKTLTPNVSEENQN